MLHRMSPVELLGALVTTIESRTGVTCCADPDNVPSPLYSVELTGTEPRNTKTGYVDRYEVDVHCISAPVEPFSQQPVLELVHALDEALTEDVELPPPFDMLNQEWRGIQAVKEDESHEGHAVVSLAFDVQYGLRCK